MKLLPAIALGSICLLGACSTPQFGRGVGAVTSSDTRIAEFRGRLAGNPSDVAALNGIGREHARRGEWTFSAGAYREALVVAPQNREALLGFAAAQTALQDFQSAYMHAQRASAIRRDVASLMAEGMALSGLGQRAQARAVFQDAVRIAPRNLDVRSNLSIALALAGDPQAYGTARAVAFAPEADPRHRRNLFLVAGITGQDANARVEGVQLGVPTQEMEEIFAIGRQARVQGVGAFGLANQI